MHRLATRAKFMQRIDVILKIEIKRPDSQILKTSTILPTLLFFSTTKTMGTKIDPRELKNTKVFVKSNLGFEFIVIFFFKMLRCQLDHSSLRSDYSFSFIRLRYGVQQMSYILHPSKYHHFPSILNSKLQRGHLSLQAVF